MSVFLFHGSDGVIVTEAVADKVKELLGPESRSMMLDSYIGDYVLAAVSEAAQTPPMFTDRRVIVADGVSSFGDDELKAFAEYLADPAEFTDLVLNWGSGRVAKVVADALKKGGGVSIDPTPSSRKADRDTWWKTELDASGLHLDAPAAALVRTWLGDDVNRFVGLSETLRATFGDSKITRSDVEPFLGERGDVAPWDLTDAIDNGDPAKALEVVRRLMSASAGERHALQVHATLYGHYSKLAKLDGVDARSAADAENALGLKGFPAEKALKAFRNLGSGGVRRAFELLASADLDLKGGTALDGEIVIDVLVARLARLTPVSRRR